MSLFEEVVLDEETLPVGEMIVGLAVSAEAIDQLPANDKTEENNSGLLKR